jgi:hypothetical protein
VSTTAGRKRNAQQVLPRGGGSATQSEFGFGSKAEAQNEQMLSALPRERTSYLRVLMIDALVQGRFGIALRFGGAVDGTSRYSRRQLFANAAIAASRVAS